ncbi:MAG: hypothetical protein JWR67_3850 [Mucilaginibacter sp.]|nr:hypothetical protein [Mucilaginibacter sp.]
MVLININERDKLTRLKQLKRIKSFLACLLLFITISDCKVYGQSGMTVSPGKLYFKLPPGSAGTQKIIVSNPNDRELQVGASISDWDYDTVGNNRMHEMGSLKTSCAEWFKVLPSSVFTLQPNERREVQVVFTTPADADRSVPVHTAMLFLTQMNPVNSRSQNGAAIKVSVRIGIKIYHSFLQTEDRDIEVIGLQDKAALPGVKGPGMLELQVQNTGKIWLEGKIKWELLNTKTGQKTKMEDQDFYSLPGDKRTIRQNLPRDLQAGHYTATAVINYGNKDELKVVELEFEN